MSDHLKEAWKRVSTQLNESEESKQFNALLESIFKRKIVRVKKSVLESRYRKMKTLTEANPLGAKQDEDPETGVSNDQGDDTTPLPADRKSRNSGDLTSAPTTSVSAPDTAVDKEKIIALQAKTPRMVQNIIDIGGNGIPEVEDSKKVLKTIKNSATSLDPVLIDAITAKITPESTGDAGGVGKIIRAIIPTVKDKGKFDNPKIINSIFSEIQKLIPRMSFLKAADANMKMAYSLYLSFVMANGFASAGVTGGTESLGNAFENATDAKSLFTALQTSTKSMDEEQAIEAALQWAENNGPALHDEAASAKIQKNLPIYIKNVYKYRSLGATLKRQSDVIFKMTNGG